MKKINNIEELKYISNYESDIPYILSGNIWEYDMKQANINCLLSSNYITREQYDKLSNYPKYVREKEVGLMERNDKNIFEIIRHTISEVRHCFLIWNKLNIDNIIKVSNDAVFVNRPFPVDITIINHPETHYPFTFVLKNHYTDYINLNGILIFININERGQEWEVDVKGINDNELFLFEAFIGFICKLIQALKTGRNNALLIYHDFYDKYVSKSLPIEYYREFRSNGTYRITTKSVKGFDLGIYSPFQEVPLELLDISYNIYLLRLLYRYIFLEQI